MAIPIPNLVHRLPAAEVSRCRIVCRVTDGNGVPASGTAGEAEYRTGIIFALQRDRTRCQAERIGGEHHVLSDTTRVELVTVGLFHQSERYGCSTKGNGEVTAFAETFLLGTIDNDEGPVLEILAAPRPTGRFEQLFDQIVRRRFVAL